MSISTLKFTRTFVLLATAILFVAPLIWILSISFQPTDAIYSGNYRLVPEHLDLTAYAQSLFQNERGVRSSLMMSLAYGLISTSVSMLLALIAIYLIRVDVISQKQKIRILIGSISLFFLPAFILIPGLQKVSEYVEIEASILHIGANVFIGYVSCFVFLLFVFATAKSELIEQLLLDTKSRSRAFIYFIFGHYQFETTFVYGLTFTTIWSEFFVSGMITKVSDTRPFSVALLTAKGQYATDYSLFAAGAVISFLIFAVLILIISLIFSYLFSESSKTTKPVSVADK